ncbi:RNA polymerase sigma factor ShbA [Pseudonocardia sp. TRM90224]|uniref:RNA polymerase sigma factor ShbA n=1 Tax=Pseudonocardia sp. TRM90224 TaxID=2812678 RepID=UPI001E40EE34|nr:RNA polymerase sigma factor ShbA [Pseudonocardia sp. TRM90224]
MERSSDIADELVTAAVAGDRTAIEHLLAVIRPVVVRYCRARLGRTDRSWVAADDVAQEVLAAVFSALPGYRQQGKPFLAYVYGIAARKLVDAHRAAARRPAVPVADIPESVDGADGPPELVLRGELADRLGRLLDLLPEPQREVVIMRVALGFSAQETAAALGSTPGSVRVTQHRALARLRKAVAADLPA